LEDKKMKKTYLPLMVGMVTMLATLFPGYSQPTDAMEKIPEITEMEREMGIKMTARGVKYIVDPEKLVGGGPPKDGIPSIDDPKFVSVEQADRYIQDNELVLAIIYKGVKRVYPLQILVWHEIVNDVIADDPVLITYCPLCGSGIAFERRIENEEVEFGVSGKLYNSNLVMYDRKTNSYWSQIDGLAIIGELSGARLNLLPIDTVTWREWKKEHLDSEVLSQETGYVRAYGRDPYGEYYEDSFVWFPVENNDDRVHPKTVILGIEVEGLFKAYKEQDVKELGLIEDSMGENRIRIERDSAGAVHITNLETGKEIVAQRGFWFAWYAFHPDTQLYAK